MAVYSSKIEGGSGEGERSRLVRCSLCGGLYPTEETTAWGGGRFCAPCRQILAEFVAQERRREGGDGNTADAEGGVRVKEVP